MAQPVENFIRKAGLMAGSCNIVLNSLFSWLGNMSRADVQQGSAAVDTVITSIIMSLLMALFISADTRRALKAGTIALPIPDLSAGRLLRRLPARPWKLGLLLGLGVALVLTSCMMGLFSLFGVTALSFFAFLSIKVVYSMLLGYAVARWVILRQLIAV
ncbi:hypothetical protein [Desulfovibrio sp.]|uniref:hypothetical protein n=1 Tax=Desulfovibrio sp. TaxID=885 RepID=UPI003D0C5FDE